MARVKTKGLVDGELIRLTEPRTENELTLWRLDGCNESPSGRKKKVRDYCIVAHNGAYSGHAALRALARAILLEVPAPRKRAKKP